MNLKQGLKSALHTLELAAVAIEKDLPVEACKIAMVVNATLKSVQAEFCTPPAPPVDAVHPLDRKSTRLNSSHQIISYAVFCLKKKNTSLPYILNSITHT